MASLVTGELRCDGGSEIHSWKTRNGTPAAEPPPRQTACAAFIHATPPVRTSPWPPAASSNETSPFSTSVKVAMPECG